MVVFSIDFKNDDDSLFFAFSTLVQQVAARPKIASKRKGSEEGRGLRRSKRRDTYDASPADGPDATAPVGQEISNEDKTFKSIWTFCQKQGWKCIAGTGVVTWLYIPEKYAGIPAKTILKDGTPGEDVLKTEAGVVAFVLKKNADMKKAYVEYLRTV